jgi:phosphoribosyl 1,2-cyclic phosphodiesterase
VIVRCCGVRGSTPAPGAAYVQVGGHTSCLAVSPAHDEPPRLILDAGTGIRNVTPLLAGAPFSGTILLSHLHWDHVQGLPFFTAADREDAATRLLVPDSGRPAIDELARVMGPPHFPIGPDGLRGRWRFETLDEGEFALEGLRVRVREVPHKGGRTLGYRVEDASGSLAYLPDHRPATGPAQTRVLELVAGVDLLVHDAQFLASERSTATAYGHATVDQAVALACAGRVGTLALFHHAPTRTDAALDVLRDGLRDCPVPVVVATEGLELAVGG